MINTYDYIMIWCSTNAPMMSRLNVFAYHNTIAYDTGVPSDWFRLRVQRYESFERWETYWNMLRGYSYHVENHDRSP